MLKQYLKECEILQAKIAQKSPTQRLILACQDNLNPSDYTLSFLKIYSKKK